MVMIWVIVAGAAAGRQSVRAQVPRRGHAAKGASRAWSDSLVWTSSAVHRRDLGRYLGGISAGSRRDLGGISRPGVHQVLTTEWIEGEQLAKSPPEVINRLTACSMQSVSKVHAISK